MTKKYGHTIIVHYDDITDADVKEYAKVQQTDEGKWRITTHNVNTHEDTTNAVALEVSHEQEPWEYDTLVQAMYELIKCVVIDDGRLISLPPADDDDESLGVRRGDPVRNSTTPRSALVTSENTTVSEFVTDASDLGITAMYIAEHGWPEQLETTLGNKRPFIARTKKVVDGDLQYVSYRQNGGLWLRVFND